MKKATIKKIATTARQFAFVLFLVLIASIGLGIGVPIPKRKKDKVAIELVQENKAEVNDVLFSLSSEEII